MYKMGKLLIGVAVIIFLFAIFNVTATSIGIKCYTKCPNPYQYNSSENFLVANIVFGLFLMFIAVLIGYIGKD